MRARAVDVLKVANDGIVALLPGVVEQKLTVADHRVERGAKFVAHAGDEVGLGGAGLLGGGGQALKVVGRRDEIAELALESLLRSEEHTSELQSLMRTSYAVFCL